MKTSAYAVSWWFGQTHPTEYDIGCMSWRIVKAETPTKAWLVALTLDDIASYNKPLVLALVLRGSRALNRPKDYIHGYQLQLTLEKKEQIRV